MSHELSHVAHRDVLVMTLAGFLGVAAGIFMRWGMFFGGGRRDNNNNLPFIVIWLGSIAVYFISFLLTRVLSRYRELCADRSGAYLTGKPSALASALTKISGEMARIPTRDLRETQAFNAFMFAPAFNRDSIHLAVLHPSAAGTAPRAAGQDLRRPVQAHFLTDSPVGIFKNVFGRSDPPQANLDNLFALPSAAITLQVSTGFRPTGLARSATARPKAAPSQRPRMTSSRLLDADGGPKVERTKDDFGFTWLTCRHERTEVAELVTELHAINCTLENEGFGPSLLCSLVTFEGHDGRRLGLVYLTSKGTFYPFVPTGPNQRDNSLELQVRGVLAEDLTIEPELGRWMALYDAPTLRCPCTPRGSSLQFPCARPRHRARPPECKVNVRGLGSSAADDRVGGGVGDLLGLPLDDLVGASLRKVRVTSTLKPPYPTLSTHLSVGSYRVPGDVKAYLAETPAEMSQYFVLHIRTCISP